MPVKKQKEKEKERSNTERKEEERSDTKRKEEKKKRDESRRMGLRQETEEHFGNPITHFAQYMACSSVPLASENHFDI